MVYTVFKMKLIVGLGNAGKNYEATRHNLGFLMLDFFAKEYSLRWQEKIKFKALCTEYSRGEEKILLIKPQTFYNNSGDAVRTMKEFYKIENEDILIIHDELALPFGTIRIRHNSSDAGNNGVKSISAHIGTNYWRIRIGIWNELQEKMDDADFVLSKFSKDEANAIQKTIHQEVLALMNSFLNNDLKTTSFTL